MKKTIGTIRLPDRIASLMDRTTREEKLADIADAAMLQWDILAGRAMSARSARAYKAGIEKHVRPGAIYLLLTGILPRMIEGGWHYPGGIDLRRTLLRGPRVKMSADGHRYRVIRFRVAAPGGAGHAGRPAPTKKPHHARDPGAGAVKAGGVTSTFRTISSNPATKRPREGGGHNWRHPGIQPRHLIPEVQQFVNRAIRRLLTGGDGQ